MYSPGILLGMGRAAVGGADEKQTEYKSLHTRRKLATTPAWALSRGIEMAKTENRKPWQKGGLQKTAGRVARAKRLACLAKS